ncbi:MAG: glycosyltransferase family 4 protein [Ruthenibacterium sp.]
MRTQLPAGMPRVFGRILRHFTRRRIVFVSGEPNTQGEVYRVSHLLQALSPDLFYLHALTRDTLYENTALATHCSVLWIWRMPRTPALAQVIAAAQQNGAKVVFDVDDLMLSPAHVVPEYIEALLLGASKPELDALFAGFGNTLAAADYCCAPTATLLREMRAVCPKGRVIPNCFSADELAAAEAASRGGKPNDGFVRIGYASGTRTHQQDFSVAYPALCAILQRFPKVKFVCYSDTFGVEEFPEFAALHAQIEVRQSVPFAALMAEIARYDIAIAPLRAENTFCACKSEIKWMEAALVRVPVVASPTPPYQNAIANGVTGFLAEDTAAWTDKLTQLVESAALRKKMGEAAFAACQKNYGPARTAAALEDILGEVLQP